MSSTRYAAISAAVPVTSRSPRRCLMPPAATAAAAPKGKTMLEFRKEIFADERDDNLIEIGQPTARQDILGHVTGTSPYYDDHRFSNLLHLKILRSPHAHARIRSIDDSAAARAPRVKQIIRAADVPVNLNTLLSLIQFGKDD